jgi:transcription elongation factor Elf1
MSFDSLENNSHNAQRTEAYDIRKNFGDVLKLSKSTSDQKKKVMFVRCRVCGEPFETTFSADEIDRFSSKQNEVGTLHLCPNCGDLSLYKMNDYFEK